VSREDQDIELLQSFVWMERNWKGMAKIDEKKPIDLLKAHEVFRNYVLLGEPGSGKTTCLQYLIGS
jgi:predicted NACHT family NTPase